MTSKETIKLALAAYKVHAIDGVDFDFIEANPTRANELTEFVEWKAANAATEGASFDIEANRRERELDRAMTWSPS